MSIDVSPEYIFIHAIKYSWTIVSNWNIPLPFCSQPLQFSLPSNQPTLKEASSSSLMAKPSGQFSTTVFLDLSSFESLLSVETLHHLPSYHSELSRSIPDYPSWALPWELSSWHHRNITPWMYVQLLLIAHKFLFHFYTDHPGPHKN